MQQAVFDQTTIDMDVVGSDNKNYGFRSTGSVMRFPGFLKLWQAEEDKNEDENLDLPDLKENSAIKCKDILAEKHMTQPPPRYSESSLIKELEEKGIGRPSTYASILSTIQDRKYVEKKENRFYPTELGQIVTDLLSENFSNIVDVKFTANMEEQLDQIEEGKVNWIKALKTFYDPFEEVLKNAQEKMRDVKREETPTDLTCPKCSKPLILKWGKNGKFAACQGYPECRFTSEFVSENGTIKLVEQPKTNEICPNCQNPMVVKTGRFGRFLACSSYPTCKPTNSC
jgi:DNA topoisomerase-1